MSISQKFIDAKRQRASEIIKGINKNILEAIACSQLMQQPVYKKEFVERFENTYSSHALTYIQHSLLHSGTLCITRLWDTQTDALSIPSLMKILKTQYMRNAIKDRRRRNQLAILREPRIKRYATEEPARFEAIRKMAENDAAKASAQVDRDITDLRKLVADQEFQNLRRRIVNFRNRFIAHSLSETRSEKKARRAGVSFENARWGDMESAVKLTGPIVTRLNLIFDDVHTWPEDTADAWSKYSGAFWGSFKSRPD